MSVQQVLRKLGQWSITLTPEAPTGVVGSLEYFGHIAVIPGRVNPAELGDDLRSMARYVGILRSVESGDSITLSGVGMEAWLGNEDGNGDLIEPPGINVTSATFANAIRAVLPQRGGVTEGILHSGVSGVITKNFIFQSPRSAIDYICDTMSAEWKVSYDAKLHAGPASALFRTTPTCVIVRKNAGYDQLLKAIPGTLSSSMDAKDYTTRVIVVADSLATGSADAAENPYVDMHGNPVRVTRLLDEQDDTGQLLATPRAQAALNAWSGLRRSVKLTASEFDIAGDFSPGDVVWCYDPDINIADLANEMTFRGTEIFPMAVRVLSVTWPIEKGYTVAHRAGDGTWTDLTQWVSWEGAGGGEIEVADRLDSALIPSAGSIGTQIAGSPGDASIPGVPTFLPFSTSSYVAGDGLSRASIVVSWTTPLNVDGSTILDGDHYEISYRVIGTVDWQTSFVNFDQNVARMDGLASATTYEFRIRAVDHASPVNAGDWSGISSFRASIDVTPPPAPQAPSVASSLIAIQVTHNLGMETGGAFNLPLDLDHFEVHNAAAFGFTPDATTLVGKLTANAGMILGNIPAVGTFPTSSTVAVYVKVIAVDSSGNRSTPSPPAGSTATLIDDSHITNLTVTKVTAGTITATWLMGGLIRTAASGARVELDAGGVSGYDSSGTKLTNLSNGGGWFLKSATSGPRVEFDNAGLRLYGAGGVLKTSLVSTDGSATFSGTITASTMIGSTIKTSNSGARVEVDSTGLKCYDAGGTIQVAFFTGDGSSIFKGALAGATGTFSGNLSAADGTFKGQLTGASGSFSGNLTAGSVTASSITGNFFSSTSSGGSQVIIDTGSSSVYSISGDGSSGFISSTSEGTQRIGVYSSGGSGMYAENGNVFLYSTACSLALGEGVHSATLSTGNNINLTAGTGVYATGSSIARLESGANTYVGLTDAATGMFVTSGLIRLNAGAVTVGQSGGVTGLSGSTVLLSNIVSSSANIALTMGAGRNLYYVISTLKAKVSVEPLADISADDVMALRPVSYRDRREVEEAGTEEGIKRHLGFIAEEVADIPAIDPYLVVRDDDGDPLTLIYERIPVLHQVVLAEHHRDIADLRSKIAELEARLSA